ncbi:MAG: hypothetical protein ACXABD_12380 [Candidatus Thorarchaeota archaeon]|jgi:hypothetical protein
MTSEDILQRLKGVVECDWAEDTFRVNFMPISDELMHSAQKSGLKPKEYEQWIQMGLDLMMKGIPTLDERLGAYTFSYFPAVLVVMRQPIDIEKPWVIDSFVRQLVEDNERSKTLTVSVDFYHRFFEQIKHPEEKPLYFDFFTTGIGEGFNRNRSGGVIVTNQRLLSIGADMISTAKYMHRYDIFYPDIHERAFYGSLDYVDLKSIIFSENRYGRLTKRIELELREIEWIKSNPRHFYGPLFFKAQLSDKVEVSRGRFRLAFKPSPLKGFEKKEKDRQQRLYDQIESARAALKR